MITTQSINPFAGTNLEESWQQGFAAAMLMPDADHAPPSPLTPEDQDAFRKGVTAGEEASGQFKVPPSGFDEAGDWGKLAEVGGHAAVEGGHFFFELFVANGVGKLTLAEVGKCALGGSLSLFLGLVFTGALTGEGEFGDELIETAARQALRRVGEKLMADGSVDNVDLFLAVCDEQGHNLGAGDEILKNGFWHGRIFTDFQRAAAEGRGHGHSGSVRVVHSQTASPGIVEVIDIT